MSQDLSSFVQETFDELLYSKKEKVRNGFAIKGNKPLCLVPHREFSQFMQRMFTPMGCDKYHIEGKPSIEYMGFILVSSDIDKIMFCIEI
jgi:hypothetical protein